LNVLKTLHRRRLARNASWILLGQGASLLLKAAQFLLLARVLGATEYGIFAGVFALVNVVAPYSMLGSDLLFMHYVTVKRSNGPVYWGNSIIANIIMSAIISVAALFAVPSILHIHSVTLIVAMVFANCLFTQIAAVASRVFQTYDRMRISAFLRVIGDATRVLALLFMWIVMGHATAVQWSVGMLAATGVTGLVAAAIAQSAIGKVSLDLPLFFRRIPEGIAYSFGDTAMVLYNDFDKTLLSHYGMNHQNGVYSLGYRVLDFCCTPIWSISIAALPQYFALRQKGMAHVVRLLLKALAASVSIGAVMGLIMWVAAPFLPHLVGRDFIEVKLVLRMLCFIPLFRGVHMLAGGALTASGNQNLRLAAQFTVAALNLGLNILWIPTHGWRGAAWSSVISDGALALLTAILVIVATRRSQPKPAHLEMIPS